MLITVTYSYLTCLYKVDDRSFIDMLFCQCLYTNSIAGVHAFYVLYGVCKCSVFVFPDVCSVIVDVECICF